MFNKVALQSNQRRWQEVAEIIIEEERQSSPQQRWQKLNALYLMAAGLQILPDSKDMTIEVLSLVVWRQAF